MTTKKQKQESITYLQSMLKPGSTVYTVLRSVSASGTTRHISLLVETKEGLENISWHAANVFGEKAGEKFGHWTVKAQGCGTDMGFECVYSLGRYLFPNGFIPAEAGRNYGRNGTDAKELDTDGGYALNQRWI